MQHVVKHHNEGRAYNIAGWGKFTGAHANKLQLTNVELGKELHSFAKRFDKAADLTQKVKE